MIKNKFSIITLILLAGLTNLSAFPFMQTVDKKMLEQTATAIDNVQTTVNQAFKILLNYNESPDVQILENDKNKIGTKVLGDTLKDVKIKIKNYFGPIIVKVINKADENNINNIKIKNNNKSAIQLNNNTILFPFVKENIDLSNIVLESVTKDAQIVVYYLNYKNTDVKDLFNTNVDFNFMLNLKGKFGDILDKKLEYSNSIKGYFGILHKLFKCKNNKSFIDLDLYFKNQGNIKDYANLTASVCKLDTKLHLRFYSEENQTIVGDTELNANFDFNNNCTDCLTAVINKYFDKVESDDFAIRPYKFLIVENITKEVKNKYHWGHGHQHRYRHQNQNGYQGNGEEHRNQHRYRHGKHRDNATDNNVSVVETVDKVLLAGMPIDLKIYALGKNNEIAENYNESPNIVLKYLSYNNKDAEKVKPDNFITFTYNNSEYTDFNNVKFEDGRLEFKNFKFENVGKINIKIEEKTDKYFASIDNEDSLISPDDVNNLYKVAKYNIDINLNSNNDKDYTLLDNNLKRNYGLLSIKLTGKTVDDKTTTLLDNNYYIPEEVINLKIKFNNIPEDEKINIEDKDGNIISILPKDTLNIKVPNDNWKEGINDLEYKINFERYYNKYVNAFKPGVDTVSIFANNTEVDSDYKFNSNTEFRYAFIYTPDIQIVNKNNDFYINNIKYFYVDNNGDFKAFKPDNVEIKPIAAINKLYNGLVDAEQASTSEPNEIHFKLNLSKEQIPTPFKITLHYNIPDYLWYQPLSNKYVQPNLDNLNSFNCLYHPCQDIIYTDKKINTIEKEVKETNKEAKKYYYPTTRVNY